MTYKYNFQVDWFFLLTYFMYVNVQNGVYAGQIVYR